MAKLSARGRKEVFRVAFRLPDSESATERVERYAVMNDRAVLRRYSVRFRKDGRAHDWGWQLAPRKVKPGHFRAFLERLLAEGGHQDGVADLALVGE